MQQTYCDLNRTVQQEILAAFCGCPPLETEDRRSHLVAKLPPTVKNGLKRGSDTVADVEAILKRCVLFSGGLLFLLQALAVDGPTRPFQHLLRTLNRHLPAGESATWNRLLAWVEKLEPGLPTGDGLLPRIYGPYHASCPERPDLLDGEAMRPFPLHAALEDLCDAPAAKGKILPLNAFVKALGGQAEDFEPEPIPSERSHNIVAHPAASTSTASQSGAADGLAPPATASTMGQTAVPPEPSISTAVPVALQVFLCHGREDKATVRQLYERLRADGIAPWLDEMNLLPGQNWKTGITRAVRESHVVLVCLSSRTVRKESFIQKEIKLALDVADEKPEGTIFLIPVRLEECEVPDRVSDLHWVDYFAEHGYERLRTALEYRAKEIGAVLRPVVSPVGGPVASPAAPKSSINARDGAELILIPAGEFTMGSTEAEIEALLQSNAAYKREWFTSELPQHRVSLDAYGIYKTPVTARQYRQFCRETGREMPPAPDFNAEWREENHPIVNVSWDDAQAYCEWAGASLPTEAQWEKAARGPNGLEYPWGDDWDKSRCANSLRGTQPVGSFPSGASPYLVLDLAGNVWEWCADWFDESYYRSPPSRNPAGPETGRYRVLRGGSWLNLDPNDFRCAYRSRNTPDYRYINVGFRCVVRSDTV